MKYKTIEGKGPGFPPEWAAEAAFQFRNCHGEHIAAINRNSQPELMQCELDGFDLAIAMQDMNYSILAVKEEGEVSPFTIGQDFPWVLNPEEALFLASVFKCTYAFTEIKRR